MSQFLKTAIALAALAVAGIASAASHEGCEKFGTFAECHQTWLRNVAMPKCAVPSTTQPEFDACISKLEYEAPRMTPAQFDSFVSVAYPDAKSHVTSDIVTRIEHRNKRTLVWVDGKKVNGVLDADAAIEPGQYVKTTGAYLMPYSGGVHRLQVLLDKPAESVSGSDAPAPSAKAAK
jgi:hypothetical protein